MRTFRSKAMVLMLMVIIFMLMGCVGPARYKTMYGVTDWYYINHVTLQSQYNASTPEQQAWLRANVNPYMNMMQQSVIAMSAIENKDDIKVSKCATEILRISTGIQYDASKIIVAIKAKDYDALLAEALILKTFIIQKLAERK